MKKKLFSRVISIIVVLVLALTALPMTISAAPPKVSSKSHEVSLNGAVLYLCNETPIKGTVGEKMYMTYTVANVKKIPANSQQGLLGCDSFGVGYPYQSGGLLRSGTGTELLMKPGYTYFIEFTVTKDGFDYVIGMAKGDKSTYQYMASSTEKLFKVTDTMNHLGVFLDGGSTDIKLTNVHVYDVNGKDLGIDGSGLSDTLEITEPVPPSTKFKGSYTVKVSDVFDLYIGNRVRNKTDKQYFEFTVVSSNSRLYQTGVWVNCLDTNRTDGDYKHHNKNYENPPPSELLHIGARYLITCYNTYKASQGWDVIVQRTNTDGTTEWFKFNTGAAWPKSINNNGYSQLSFGEGPAFPSNFVLKDFRIYDANHQDLGIKSNRSIEVEHFGEISYYDQCETMFYNYETDAYVTTYADKTIQITQNGKTRQGTYKVVDSILTATFGNSTEKFEHTRNFLKDMDGKRWEAIGHVKATFVTGTDEKIPEQKLKLSEGYKVTKPKDPTLKGDEFVCWVTSTGEEYKFGEVQPDSVVLYAKWKNNAGKTYIAVEGKTAKVDLTIYIVIGLSVLVAAAAVAGCIIILRRSKK